MSNRLCKVCNLASNEFNLPRMYLFQNIQPLVCCQFKPISTNQFQTYLVMVDDGSRKIRRKQVCRRKTRLRKFRRSQILHPQYLPPTLYTPFHCTLPRTFTYQAWPFGVHCLSPIRRNFLRRVFLRQTCLRRIFRTRVDNRSKH